jgi:hypothetical protein
MSYKDVIKSQKLQEAEQEKRLADMKEEQLKEEDRVKKEENKRRQELYH